MGYDSLFQFASIRTALKYNLSQDMTTGAFIENVRPSIQFTKISWNQDYKLINASLRHTVSCFVCV
jgi:hypothetical protein